jgi:hypothetical protein
MASDELQELWSTTPGGIDIPVSATARGAELRRRDQFDDLPISERDQWRARLRFQGSIGVTPFEETIDQVIAKYALPE